MRTKQCTFVLGIFLGFGLLGWNVPTAFAQKGGGGKGGGGGHASSAHSTGGHASSAHSSGAYHSGGAYHNGAYHNGYHYPGYRNYGYGVGLYFAGSGYYGNYYPSTYYPSSSYTPGYIIPASNLTYGTSPNSDYQSNYYLPPQPQAPAGPLMTVTINTDGFGPNQLNVALGTKVRWINNTPGPHALAQPSQNWISPPISNGQSYTWTFTEPGEYELQDANNPAMKMIITVR